MAKTAPMPALPPREVAAMRTQLMSTVRMDANATRASELPAQMAAALARVAETAARFATNEARACVRTLLIALDVGAVDEGKRVLEAYVKRVGFIGAPPSDVQETLRSELESAYEHMSFAQKRQFDEIFAAAHRTNPKAWFFSGTRGREGPR